MNTTGNDNNPFGSAAVLITADSPFHADALVAVLADHDIDAFAAPGIQHGTGLDPSSANLPVPVLVHQDDLERARAALQQNLDDAHALNWDELDGGDVNRAAESPAQPRRSIMPMLPRLGFFAAAILIAVMIIGILIMYLI